LKMNKKYTHLFFDLDNTLWDFETNARRAMFAAFGKFGTDHQNVEFDNFFEVYSKHNLSLWLGYRNNTISKKNLIRQRFQMTFDELNISGIDPEVMNAFYLGEMAEQTCLKPGVNEILNFLKGKNYSMFIITNGFKEVQFKKMENTGLDKFFQKVFISEEIKVSKPGYEIFEYAIKSSNARKANSLMIGDDWETDILGAVGFGIDAVYIRPDDFEPQNNSPEKVISGKKVYFIKELNELRFIL